LLLIKPAATAVVGAAGTYQSISLIAPRAVITSPRKRYLARLDFRRSSAPVDVVTQNVTIESVLRTKEALSLTASLRRL
jgi:hypothetical protein